MIKHSGVVANGIFLASLLGLVACGGGSSSTVPGGAPGAPDGAGAAAPARSSTVDGQATTSASTSSVEPAASAATSSQGAGADACTLVTQQDASTALGVAAATGASDNSRSCRYKGPANETVSVLLLPGSQQALAAGRAHAQGHAGYQDIPGLGDGAFVTGSAGSGQFYCLKGSTILTITVSLGTGGGAGDALATLGKTACGRL